MRPADPASRVSVLANIRYEEKENHTASASKATLREAAVLHRFSPAFFYPPVQKGPSAAHPGGRKQPECALIEPPAELAALVEVKGASPAGGERSAFWNHPSLPPMTPPCPGVQLYAAAPRWGRNS